VDYDWLLLAIGLRVFEVVVLWLQWSDLAIKEDIQYVLVIELEVYFDQINQLLEAVFWNESWLDCH